MNEMRGSEEIVLVRNDKEGEEEARHILHNSDFDVGLGWVLLNHHQSSYHLFLVGNSSHSSSGRCPQNKK